MKEVSIIIPIYNVEKYVAECLNSVISQTYNHSKIECIIVDDCTPDRSMDIVNEIIGNYKGSMTFIVKKHDFNQGLSAARNTGIDIATGRYVYFLDSDDYIYPNTIEILLAEAKHDKEIDMVVGNFFNESHNKPHLNIHKDITLFNIDLLYFGKMKKLSSWNNLIKRTLFSIHNLRFPIGRYFEDIMLNYQLYSYVNKVLVVSQCTYFYRDNPSGIIRKQSIEKQSKSINDYLFALDLFISNLNRNTCVGKTAIIIYTYHLTYDLSLRINRKTEKGINIKEKLKHVRHMIVKYHISNCRIFLLTLSLFTFSPLVDCLLNYGFIRRKIDYIYRFFLYPALWTDKLHIYNYKYKCII